MKHDVQKQLQFNLQQLFKLRPLILNILNIVSVNDVVNALLAVHCSPVVSDEINDALELAAVTKSIYVNIGTLSAHQYSLAKNLLVKSYQKVPIVLDIVGCGATAFRTGIALKLIKFTNVIKGNYAEIASLLKQNKNLTKGVDGDITLDQPVKVAQKLAHHFKKFVVMSGKIDIVCDEHHSYQLAHGVPMLKQITGTGCMLGGLIAAFLTLDLSLESCMHAVLVITLAAERAIKKAKGPYSFRTNLLDEIYQLKHSLLTTCYEIKLT